MSDLEPIDWWVWTRRNAQQLVSVLEVTMLRARLAGIRKMRGALTIADVDTEVVREGETRSSKLAQLTKVAA